MTTKPKSPAKLAAEASDKLDQLAEQETAELHAACSKYEGICNLIRGRFTARHDAIWAGLPDEAAAKLRALRGEVVELIDPEELADELDTIPTDEPTHLREVTP